MHRTSARVSLGAAILACSLAAPAPAQEISGTAPAQAGEPGERPDWFDVAWPGAALGAGGFVIGAVAGAALADCTSNEDTFCGLEGAFFGAAALGTIGLATGVHLGNDRRGNFGVDLLTASGLWAATIGVLAASDWDDTLTALFFALPVGQFLATVAVERSIGDRRARERLEIGLGPSRDGGIAFAGRIRF